MDFHLGRKVVLTEETEFKNLYKWSLEEQDDAGKRIGINQVPWSWSVVFTATELMLSEEFKLGADKPLAKLLKPEEGTDADETFKTTERDYIRAELRPGYFADADGREYYSMFGTDRPIKSFQLSIHKLAEDKKEEWCAAWGSVSYTMELDFRNETADDTLQFYLHVTPERFEQYRDMVRKYPANLLVLRLTHVSGLYSEWSPSISTDRIKVLTNLDDHKVAIPEGLTIKPPTLGKIGAFDLSIITRRQCDKPPRTVEHEPGDDKEAEPDTAQTPEEEALLLQRASLKLSVINERRLKQLSYAAWAIVVLLALIYLRR